MEVLKKQNGKNNKGITLIALVVTIIVLIILAGISISLVLGNNGIITKTKDAKEDTVISQEKEQVELAYISAAVKKLGDNVDKDDLQEELDASVGNNKTDVTNDEDDTLNVLFKDTEHNYNVDGGKVSKVEPLELHISNYGELLDFANRVNDGETFENYIVYLDKDIDMENDEWIVIGTPGGRIEPRNTFRGVFEGNNHTIDNLKISNIRKRYSGLFGYNEGTIQNLNIKGSISGQFGNCHIGLFSGYNEGSIHNCTALIDFDSQSSSSPAWIGGISGGNGGTISSCITRGEMSIMNENLGSSAATGGIIGDNNGEIVECKNFINIKSGTTYVGGICGDSRKLDSKMSIRQCVNYGLINLIRGNITAGGIIGSLDENGIVEQCASKGDFSSTYSGTRFAGICGELKKDARISDCYFSGVCSHPNSSISARCSMGFH